MPLLPIDNIRAIVARMETAPTNYEKGKAFEDLFCAIFQSIPGIEIARRDEMNAFLTEEVDVVLWNNRLDDGLVFLPNIILVECKNWSSAIGSSEVVYFKEKLSTRDCPYGFFIAANGITGNREELSRAHFNIATALAQKTWIVVINLNELLEIRSSEELVKLIKIKMLDLVLQGTSQ